MPWMRSPKTASFNLEQKKADAFGESLRFHFPVRTPQAETEGTSQIHKKIRHGACQSPLGGFPDPVLLVSIVDLGAQEKIVEEILHVFEGIGKIFSNAAPEGLLILRVLNHFSLF